MYSIFSAGLLLLMAAAIGYHILKPERFYLSPTGALIRIDAQTRQKRGKCEDLQVLFTR